jgi:hypothetical protein
MNKRWLIHLILLFAVAGLALVALLEPGRGTAPPPLPPISALTPQQIETITIERAGQPAVELRRAGEDWRIASPLALPANRFKVEQILGLLKAGSQRQMPAADLNLADFKLAPPQITARFGTQLTLLLGDTAPLGMQRYIQAGDTVHLVADVHYPFLAGPPASFVDLFVLGQQPVLEEIRLPGYSLRLNNGAWEAPESLEPRPSAEALKHLAEQWRLAQAVRVLPAQDTPPQGEIAIKLAGQADPLRFALLARTPDLILARGGVEYHLPADQADSLLQPLPPAKP